MCSGKNLVDKAQLEQLVANFPEESRMTDEYWVQEATRLSLLEQDLWKSMQIIIDADAPNMPQEVPERRPDDAVVNNQVAAQEKKASQRAPCLEWIASQSCRFGDTCMLLHDSNHDVNPLQLPVNQIPAAEPPPPQDEPVLPLSNDVDDGSECVMCLDAPKTMAFVPCGHMCVCESCSESIEPRGSRRCPMCRAVTSGKIKVYLA